MNKTMTYLAASILAASVCTLGYSQDKKDGSAAVIEGVAEFDRTIYDFGDVMQDQGALTCTFTVKNVSQSPIVIYNVVTSCGCTDVNWTREPVRPGATGKITATYKNDEGPYPFDKNLTAYISGVKKPIVLRLRGVVHAKKQPLGQTYTVKRGSLGLRAAEVKLGNISQGGERGDAVNVANLGQAPLKVEFSDVTPGLQISVSPNPIPVGQTAKMTYKVTAGKNLWGKNYYYASPVVGGRKYSPIAIWTFTKEDFSDWSEQQLKDASQPSFETVTYNFGKKRKGESVKASFTVRNLGGSPFVVHKAESDSDAVSPVSIPSVPSGESLTFSLSLDTSRLSAGDNEVVVRLITNCPLRPVVNLTLQGTVI